VQTVGEEESLHPQFGVARSGVSTLVLTFAGDWRSGGPFPPVGLFEKELSAPPPVTRVTFKSDGISSWDSGFLTFLVKLRSRCAAKEIELDTAGLPEGAARLLRLASAVPEREGARKKEEHPPFLERVGTSAVAAGRGGVETLAFLGETVTALGALLRGKARFLGSDLTLFIQECGAQALPIVSLISFLVGVILAFVGAVQLSMFGAEIYVADLVGLAMVRAMGAIMTGIVLAGRTGAAFAAQLGTMQVNEEIDALKTLGIQPVEFLVLPRVIALVLMMPLLCLYANLMGILGGAFVGVGMFDIGVVEYYQQTRGAISMTHVWVGLFQALVFGILVGIAGCLRGMQCGRSAWEVGAAATSAVVTGIVWIVTSCAIITMIFDQLGI
jgi:phospholipid/cholesterol/gamma-HCH transport system permease protein